MQHTKGPWAVRKLENGWAIYPANTVNVNKPEALTAEEAAQAIVTNVCGFNWHNTKHAAIANLIAAAPELYHSLAQAVQYFDSNGGDEAYTWLPAMRAALSKVKGQA
jgi:hypothetical protein